MMLSHTLATCGVYDLLKTTVADKAPILSIGQLLYTHKQGTYCTRNPELDLISLCLYVSHTKECL